MKKGSVAMAKENSGYQCPKCGKELLGYSQGRSYGGPPSYPYESGYYCPNRCVSLSNLEIARGRLEQLKTEGGK